jgi:hypothetical protein
MQCFCFGGFLHPDDPKKKPVQQVQRFFFAKKMIQSCHIMKEKHWDCWIWWSNFVGLAYQGKDIVFRFIIEYSSLRDFGP